MAYAATITKKSVTKSGGIYKISLRIVINDGTGDVLDFTISAKYNPNTPDMSAILASLQQQIKDKWDDYSDNQGIFNAAVLDSGIASLQSQVNTYIN